MAKQKKVNSRIYRQIIADLQPQKGYSNNFVLSIVAITMISVGLLVGYLMWGQSKVQTTQLDVSPTPQETKIVNSSPVPTQDKSTKIEWSEYVDSQNGYTVKYPKTYYIQPHTTGVHITEDKSLLDGPGAGFEGFNVSIADNGARDYSELYKAQTNTEVPSAAHAVNTIIIKLSNTQVSGFEAVEYTVDGVSSKVTDLGRGPVGYSHNFLIKVSESKYIRLNNTSMDPVKTKQRAAVFKELVSQLKINN